MLFTFFNYLFTFAGFYITGIFTVDGVDYSFVGYDTIMKVDKALSDSNDDGPNQTTKENNRKSK